MRTIASNIEIEGGVRINSVCCTFIGSMVLGKSMNMLTVVYRNNAPGPVLRNPDDARLGESKRERRLWQLATAGRNLARGSISDEGAVVRRASHNTITQQAKAIFSLVGPKRPLRHASFLVARSIRSVRPVLCSVIWNRGPIHQPPPSICSGPTKVFTFPKEKSIQFGHSNDLNGQTRKFPPFETRNSSAESY